MKIDFDEMSQLYKDDPERFEEVRKEIIESTIDELPEFLQQRCRGLQFTIDSTLNLQKTPISRYNKMVELFWNGFEKFRTVISNQTPTPEKTTAQIIKFTKNEN